MATTDPRRLLEARQVSETYRLAIVVLSMESMLAAYQWFSSVPASSTGADALEDWTRYALKQLLQRQKQAQDLAVAYYKLMRALMTGEVVLSDREVGLNSLRLNFYRKVKQLAPMALHPAQTEAFRDASTDRIAKPEAPDPHDATVDIPVDPDRTPYDPANWTDDERLPVADVDLEDVLDEVNDDLEADVQATLDRMALEMKTRMLREERKARREKWAKERAQEQAEEAKRVVQRVQARHGQRLTANGARATTYKLGSKDPAVKKWARVSNDGDACHFCLLLISRGAVYKSEATAQQDYHPSDNCDAVEVYSDKQYQEDPRFDVNRKLRQLWNDEFKGKKNAELLWRRYWRTHKYR